VLTGSQPDGRAFAAGEDRNLPQLDEQHPRAPRWSATSNRKGFARRRGLKVVELFASLARGADGGLQPKNDLRGTGGNGLFYCFAAKLAGGVSTGAECALLPAPSRRPQFHDARSRVSHPEKRIALSVEPARTRAPRAHVKGGRKSYSPMPCRHEKHGGTCRRALVTRCGRFGGTEIGLSRRQPHLFLRLLEEKCEWLGLRHRTCHAHCCGNARGTFCFGLIWSSAMRKPGRAA